MITENLSTLKIHKLSQEQYDREKAAGNLDPSAFYLTPDLNGATLISVHNEQYNTIVPEDGEMYIVKYDNLPIADEDGNVIISEKCVYATKVGDGTTTLDKLPPISHLSSGDGEGSLIQFVEEEAYGFEQNGKHYYPRPVASGYSSSAFGRYTEVRANHGFAANYANKITPAGLSAFATGQYNKIDAAGAFATGFENVIKGNFGAVFGGNNVNEALRGIVTGFKNWLYSDGVNSFLSGEGLVGNSSNQFIIGKYNEENSEAVLIIGNGVNNNNRSNSFVIYKDGSYEINGIKMKINPSIRVRAPEGSVVTCTNNYVTLTGIKENNLTVFQNITYGIWTVSVEINGNILKHDIVVGDEDLPILYFDIPNETFSDSSFESIVYACQNKTVPETWEIGNEKAININDKEYHLVIIGKNVDTFTNGELAPLTLQFKEIYNKYEMQITKEVDIVDWANSYLNTYYIPIILKEFPDILKESISPVIKKTLLQDGTEQETEDFIFTPSLAEVKTNRIYDYYATSSNIIKYFEGVPEMWWLRSPYQQVTSYKNQYDVALGKQATFSYGSAGPANKYGFAPAFCIGAMCKTTTIENQEEYITSQQMNEAINSAIYGAIGGSY